MEKIPCPEDKTDCKYKDLPIGCHQSRHHLMWPRSDYRKEIDREYRNLPENKVYICRMLHDLIHLELPPEKPAREDMLQALGRLTLPDEAA